MDQLISTNKIFSKNKSKKSKSETVDNSSNSPGFNGQMTKQEIKDIVLLSLLNNYCQTNNIKDPDKIVKEFSKLGLIDKNSVTNYNNDIKKQILGIISEIGIKDKKLPDISVSRVNREYIIENNLGEGAVGTVFKALNIIDMSNYAIKRINVESINPIALREVRNLSKLTHDNIVRYFSTWIDFDNDMQNLCLYIQMELCDTTLKDILKKNLQKKEKIKLFYGIICGMEYIHSNQIMHRDIKPSNILIKYINDKPIPKIGDFGLSIMCKNLSYDGINYFYETDTSKTTSLIKYDDMNKITNDKLDTDKMNYVIETYKQSYTEDIGTELYSSIEQLDSNKYNQYTDIYSLGIIYFEILNTFESNFCRIDSIQQLRNNEYNWDNFNGSKLDKVLIQKLMDRDIKKRPSATNIKKYLEKKYKYCV